MIIMKQCKRLQLQVVANRGVRWSLSEQVTRSGTPLYTKDPFHLHLRSKTTCLILFCLLSKVFFLKNQRSRSAGVVRPFMASIWTIKADEKPLRLYVKGILPRSECSWGRRQQHLSPVEHEAIFTFSKFTSLHCHLLSISIDSDTCCLLFLYTIPRTLYLALGFFHSSWNKKIGPARFLWPPTIHPSNMLSSATLNEFSKEENYF